MINEKVKNNNVTDIIKTPKKSIIPRSEKQKDYVRALRQSDIIISAGPAGTGKTFLTFSLIIKLSTDESISLFSILPLLINWLAKNFIAFLTISFFSGLDLIRIELPLEYKLVSVIFSNSFKFLLNSPTTPIKSSLSWKMTLKELLSE